MIIKIGFENEKLVSEYVSGELTCYGCDEQENLSDSLDSTKDALGRLCEILAKKGILSATEVTYIARGWENAGAVFVDDTEGSEGA